MHEKINEKIDVVVQFKGAKVIPHYFRWQNRIYKVEQVNMVHSERVGDELVYYFSVSSQANFFRLAFSSRDLTWILEEMFFE